MAANPKQEKGHWISFFGKMAGIWKACWLIQSKKKGTGLAFFANGADMESMSANPKQEKGHWISFFYKWRGVTGHSRVEKKDLKFTQRFFNLKRL